MNETLDKIKKLLALAQDKAATRGEIEAAMQAVSRLQRSSGLTDAEIKTYVHSSFGSIKIDIGAITSLPLYISKKLTRWPLWCAMAATKAVGAKLYIQKANLVAYGLATDCSIAYSLLEFCLASLDRHRNIWCLQQGHKFGSQDSKSWADGYCRGLLESAERNFTNSDVSTVPVITAENTALVMVSNTEVQRAKLNAITAWERTNLSLHAHKSSFSSAKNSSAYSDGFTKGISTKLTKNSIA